MIPLMEYCFMAYEVEFTGEFEVWWNGLTVDEQDSVDFRCGSCKSGEFI